jgi:hypothetical protein
LKFQTENSRIGVLDFNLASPGAVISLSYPLRGHRASRRAELFYQDWFPLADFFLFFSFWGPIFFVSKNLEKNTSSRTPKNLKN